MLTLPRVTRTVGIVGAGMAGLYAAYWLQTIWKPFDINVSLFEVDDRVGGRIKTYRFTEEKDQYFEAGAMRIPKTNMHQPTFDLIDLLNNKGASINLITYNLSQPGNRVLINGNLTNNSGDLSAEALGWTLPDKYQGKSGAQLLLDSIEGFLKLLNQDFDAGWDVLMRYDKVSFRTYLLDFYGGDQTVVDFIETMCSQTNQFALSFPELVIQNLDFDAESAGTTEKTEWRMIDQGMDNFPQALAEQVGLDNITFSARVTKIEESGGKVTVYADTPGGKVNQTFDKVILAIPPSALRMIPERPRWDPEKEQAIRAMYFEPLYKLGMRFKKRFWEPESEGGQSTTDLPMRWVVYPSNGIGTSGPGVLLLYSWQTDAATWSSIPLEERVKSSLTYLCKVFPEQEDTIRKEFMGAEDMAWSEHNPMGDAMFMPGQFTAYFDIAQRAEGNIYFAGEHLSRHHTWITGALDSALTTAREVLSSLWDLYDSESGKAAQPRPCGGWIQQDGSQPQEHYDPEQRRKKIVQTGLKHLNNDYDKFKKKILLS